MVMPAPEDREHSPPHPCGEAGRNRTGAAVDPERRPEGIDDGDEEKGDSEQEQDDVQQDLLR